MQIDKTELVRVIDAALEKRSRIDCESHAEHHQFIAEFIAEQHLKQERWEAIQRQVLGWGIIAIVGGIGTAIAKKFGM